MPSGAKNRLLLQKQCQCCCFCCFRPKEKEISRQFYSTGTFTIPRKKGKAKTPKPTTRWDVFKALRSVEIPGSICAGGEADQLPAVPGLCVAGIGAGRKSSCSTSSGSISLPLIDASANTLKDAARLVNDKSYHNIYQISDNDSKVLTFRNPEWHGALEEVADEACVQLGLDPSCVVARLERLLLFEKGSYMDDHREDGRSSSSSSSKSRGDKNNVVGTVMIQLPSEFTGGTFRISYNGNDEYNVELGGVAAAFGCRFMCCYADCTIGMEKIKSGRRLALEYSLCYNDDEDDDDDDDEASSSITPKAGLLAASIAPLRRSLSLLPHSDRMIIVPLDYVYENLSIANHGIGALMDEDRRAAQALKVAGSSSWRLFVIEAKMLSTTVFGVLW